MNIHTQTIKAAKYLQENLDEYQEHKATVKWIILQYPDVRFFSNEAGHGRPTRAIHLQDGSSWPDLCILERRGHYLGLWLEVKTGTHKVFKADGVTFLNDHVGAQWEMILWLRSQGFAADWGLGQEDCREKIEDYLEQVGKVFYE